MRPLVALYRRLDLLQRGLWFRVAASAVALVLCGLVFGALLARSHELADHRAALSAVLFNQQLNESAAITLRESGTIVAEGRVYGDERFARRADTYLSEDGRYIAVPARLIEHLLAGHKPAWAPDFLLEQPQTTWLLAGVAAGWLLLIIWMSITLPFLLTLIGTGVPVALAWLAGSEEWMLAFAGIGLLTFTFVLLTRGLLIAFSRPVQPLAVAHTVIKEASRLRISITFIAILLIALPLVPLLLEAEQPLRYRIQSYMSASLRLTYAIAACMTLLVACASVAFEIRDRQIWQLVTKPLARLNYLIGKWLGVVSLNLVILIISGISIFTYIQYLREQPVAAGREGAVDRMEIDGKILTARVAIKPSYQTLSADQLTQLVNDLIERDPHLAEQAARGTLSSAARRELRMQEQTRFLSAQRQIQLGQPGTFVFDGLARARELNSPLSLRYRFYISDSSEHETFPAAFVFNEDMSQSVRVEYVPTMLQSLELPPRLVREDGSIAVTIVNLPRQDRPPQEGDMIHFQEKDLEIMYQVGTFEANFVRAMLTSWLKLAFLAALAIAASTFLSFPVALLTSFTIWMAGESGPYLVIALDEYYPRVASEMDFGDVGAVIGWCFQHTIRFMAQGIVFFFHSFGDYRPTGRLVQGELLPWSMVGGAALRLGLLWSGLAMTIGYLVFRRRELATYSGHG